MGKHTILVAIQAYSGYRWTYENSSTTQHTCQQHVNIVNTCKGMTKQHLSVLQNRQKPCPTLQNCRCFSVTVEDSNPSQTGPPDTSLICHIRRYQHPTHIHVPSNLTHPVPASPLPCLSPIDPPGQFRSGQVRRQPTAAVPVSGSGLHLLRSCQVRSGQVRSDASRLLHLQVADLCASLLTQPPLLVYGLHELSVLGLSGEHTIHRVSGELVGEIISTTARGYRRPTFDHAGAINPVHTSQVSFSDSTQETLTQTTPSAIRTSSINDHYYIYEVPCKQPDSRGHAPAGVSAHLDLLVVSYDVLQLPH